MGENRVISLKKYYESVFSVKIMHYFPHIDEVFKKTSFITVDGRVSSAAQN